MDWLHQAFIMSSSLTGVPSTLHVLLVYTQKCISWCAVMMSVSLHTVSLHLHPHLTFQASLQPPTRLCLQLFTALVVSADDAVLMLLWSHFPSSTLQATTSHTFLHMLCKSNKSQRMSVTAHLLRGRSLTELKKYTTSKLNKLDGIRFNINLEWVFIFFTNW